MPQVHVDFDVFKALTMRRAEESVTENDVLRELLGLPKAPNSKQPSPPQSGTPFAPSVWPLLSASPADWISKGVRFPEGTEFRAHYKGQTYLGRVKQSALVVNDKRFDSPSAAAMDITGGKPANGWLFWECRMPGEATWRMIRHLRPKID
jgi:hypothetical protein